MAIDQRKTGERIVPELYRSEAASVLYLRHVFAYEQAKAHIRNGDSVLDLGSGSGYGTAILSASGAIISYDGMHLPFDDGAFVVVTRWS